MKAFLLFPPSWTPAMPHLALPTLTAYLRAHGLDVVQRDLNVEVKDEILTRHHLEETISRLREDYGPHARPGRSPRRRPDPAAGQWALNTGPQLALKVEEAKRVIRSESFFDGPTGQQALETIAQGLQLASLPFYPAALDLSSFTAASSEFRSRELLQAVRDPAQNPFLEIFRRGILADLQRQPPDLVGISIPSMAQLLAGLTLAALIKEAKLPCHITLGGPYLTVLREELHQTPVLFDLFDSVILFAGEKPLLRLAEVLAAGGDPSQVPNLLYRDGGTIKATALQEPETLTNLPPPDFHGLPLDKYLAPGLVLPLVTSRGCYHHKCAFCNVGYGAPDRFEQLPAESVVEQMLHLQKSYPLRHIWFADEAITPHNLRQMSPLLEKWGAPIEWSAYVRFDRAISRELLESMYGGGCRMLFFGLESASPRIMQAMQKGIELPVVKRILRDSAAAGFWNHLFFFFGFPGEMIEDAQKTVDFLYAHKHYIHSAAFDIFVLELHAPVYRAAAQYGVKPIIRDPRDDLAMYFDYQVTSGMDEQTARTVASRLLDALPKKEYAHFYVHDVYRILYASRLHQQGIPYPPWLEEGVMQ